MRIRTVVVLIVTVITVLAPAGSITRADGEVDALLLMCHQYGANYNLIRDVMEEYGWNVTTVGLSPTVVACYWGGALTVDLLLPEIEDITTYDCLAVMPARASTGSSHYQLMGNPDVQALIQDAIAQDLLVAAFCGGTRVLADANVLQGVHVTGHALYVDEYEAAGAIFVGNPVPPVLDSNILTCVRGQYYARQVVDVMSAAIDSLRAN